MEIAILIWIVCGIGATMIASSRNANGCLWFVLGMLLGPLGLIFAFSAGANRICPHCQSNIPQAATRCPKCQAELSPIVDSGPQRCSNCKTILKPGTLICPGCGAKFGAAVGMKTCPDCAEKVQAEAKKCRFCGFRFDAT